MKALMFIGRLGFIGVDDPVDPANLHSKFMAQISSDQMDWIYSTPPHSSLLANLNLAFIIYYSLFVIYHLDFDLLPKYLSITWIGYIPLPIS